MHDLEIINITPENIAQYGVCGYKNMKKHLELRKKINWFNEYYPKGLRMKILFSESAGYQGMIEYMPGEIAHRPVDADGYLFIQCIFTGFNNEYKGRGYGKKLISECIREAKEGNFKGVAVVTRSGAFMAKKDIFINLGFTIADSVEPDFDLLTLSFHIDNKMPRFSNDMSSRAAEYPSGLTIMRSAQCPYSEKNIKAIMKTAIEKYHLTPVLIDIESPQNIKQSPCAFGTFCIIYNGKVISHHPISNTRFENIMKKIICT